MSLSTILESMGLPTTLEILVAINVISIVYLIWFTWHLFVANKGDLGGLGLTLAAMAFLNLMGEASDWYEDYYDEHRESLPSQQEVAKSGD